MFFILFTRMFVRFCKFCWCDLVLVFAYFIIKCQRLMSSPQFCVIPSLQVFFWISKQKGPFSCRNRRGTVTKYNKSNSKSKLPNRRNLYSPIFYCSSIQRLPYFYPLHKSNCSLPVPQISMPSSHLLLLSSSYILLAIGTLLLKISATIIFPPGAVSESVLQRHNSLTQTVGAIG